MQLTDGNEPACPPSRHQVDEESLVTCSVASIAGTVRASFVGPKLATMGTMRSGQWIPR